MSVVQIIILRDQHSCATFTNLSAAEKRVSALKSKPKILHTSEKYPSASNCVDGKTEGW